MLSMVKFKLVKVQICWTDWSYVIGGERDN
jgi:hypothetical protein